MNQMFLSVIQAAICCWLLAVGLNFAYFGAKNRDMA